MSGWHAGLVRVLLVEDKIKLAGLLRRALRGEGLATDVAVCGEDALWMAGATRYDAMPLTMLRTELELIARERPSGQELQTAIDSAVQETDRLSELADGLLLLARADEQRLAIAWSALSATELLEQAAGRARRHPRASRRQIEVEPVEVAVLADPDRVAQALDNLVANALRHANGCVKLFARERGSFAELHVADDGPGFPAEFLPRAWERFARADEARTEDGAGLGLAIVRAIAEAHGGQAGAANTPTGGADVWITLPSALHGAGASTVGSATARPDRSSIVDSSAICTLTNT